MDFSAFLVPGMSKEGKKVVLRTVDEESTVEEPRLLRLNKDTVEEVAEETPVRVGAKDVPEARLEGATRGELKTRSNEPDLGSLIDRDDRVAVEDEWDSSSQPRKFPWGWLALAAAAFAFGIIWSLSQVGRAEKKQDELKKETRSILEREVEEELSAVDMVDTLERVAREFYDSRSIDELLRYVRHPERVRPLMEDYYSRHELKPAGVESVESMDPLTIDSSGGFWLITSILQSQGRSQLLLEALDTDSAKVDWESFVCYQPVPWEEFVSERPSGYTGEFRVYVEEDHFYAYEFSDSEKYQCLRLTTLNSDQPLYGYVERESLMAKEISEQLRGGGPLSNPMILRLHVPGNARSKRGVLVEELVAPRWMFVKSPEDGGE